MRIQDLYERGARGGEPVFSFEFFPPKTDAGATNLMATVADLKSSLEPDFISVTSGAGGSTRDRTHEIVTRVQSELGITAMAHQTCVGVTREEIESAVRSLIDGGIENVLALRGDPPRDQPNFKPAPGGLGHATDLCEFLSERFDLCLGGACYPEVHPEAMNADDDLRWAKKKQELGARFLITQLFFDNAAYLRFVERARAAGISIPIVPGIMPVTNVEQVQRFTRMCGAMIPDPLLERLRAHREDSAAVMADGIEHAITQCRELLDKGAPGLHFYTLNKSHATRSILAALRRVA